MTDPAVPTTAAPVSPGSSASAFGTDAGQPLRLRLDDLRDKVRARRTQRLILFVVDASRSMGARRRMARTKVAVLSLLIDAYQKRERDGLISFRGTSATLDLTPTRSVRFAAKRPGVLPVGGLTPLTPAERTVAAVRRRESGVVPLVVLLTDGRANVPLQQAGSPDADALALAHRFHRAGVAGLVVDTEKSPSGSGSPRGWLGPGTPNSSPSTSDVFPTSFETPSSQAESNPAPPPAAVPEPGANR